MTSVLDPVTDAPAIPPADVMQVCLNGHVITSLLYSRPDGGQSHCDRCGVETLERCRTCGEPLRGSIPSLGLEPIGQLRPPAFCAVCGATFPWTAVENRGGMRAADPIHQLEAILRRFPLVVRQLRDRHGDRPGFRVNDVHDVEDLVRALLPIYFDDARPESRTPSYSLATRVDFGVAAGQSRPEADSSILMLTVKLASAELREPELAAQWREDLAYYRTRRPTPTLLGFVYDPQGFRHDPARIERAWSRLADEFPAACVIAS